MTTPSRSFIAASEWFAKMSAQMSAQAKRKLGTFTHRYPVARPAVTANCSREELRRARQIAKGSLRVSR